MYLDLPPDFDMIFNVDYNGDYFISKTSIEFLVASVTTITKELCGLGTMMSNFLKTLKSLESIK